MVRRTKEEALATRNHLLDCAETLFQAQGVSRTSLHDIAQAAGTTRGAIYWHFQDKADLFNAMMERVTLPMEDALLGTPADQAPDPLDHLRRAMRNALRRISGDPQTRRVFEVVTQKVEYIEELHAVRERHLRVRGECLAQMARCLRDAALARGRKLPVAATTAAQGLHAAIDGLIQNWLLEPAAFKLVPTGLKVFDVYVAGLGLSPESGAARRNRG